MEPPKIPSTKSISIKQEPKTSSSLPSGSSNGKALATEKIKKDAEKRPADKVRIALTWLMKGHTVAKGRKNVCAYFL